MSRRRKTSPAEDFVDLVARLPWWACLLLGVVLYTALHSYASSPMPVPTGGQLTGIATLSVGRGLATAGQYLLPLLCLMAAAVSAWRRHERKNLLANATGSDAAGAIDGMSWQQFERLVSEGFRRQGFQVAETGGGGADGGVDLVLRRSGERHLVQCKQWRAYKVGVDVVRELYGVMTAKGAAGGFVVTSGRFTAEAKAFAAGRNVQLIDGPALQAMLKLAGQPQAAPAETANPTREPGRSPTAAPIAAPAVAAPSAVQALACPKCGQPMVRRMARTGENAGKAFFGCTDYPRCRGTRSAP